MNVLIIPEDFLKDQYILKPIFERLFRSFGKKRVKIRVCQRPRLRGVSQALDPSQITAIVERYKSKMDVFILCVDRDGNKHRRRRLDGLESQHAGQWVFLAANAWEELETWVLAGLDLPAEWNWRDVRDELHVKEQYFEPLAAERGLADAPGGGRKELGKEAARRIDAIRQKCPQDFDTLARRLEAVV